MAKAKKSGTIRDIEEYKVGPGRPPKETRFSKENRATREMYKKASKTKADKRAAREIIKDLMKGKYKFAGNSQIKQQLITAFGDVVNNMSAFEVMTLMQMQKAILKGDTYAFSTLLDHSYGKPVQAVHNVDEDGNTVKPVSLTLPKGLDISLPSNTE